MPNALTFGSSPFLDFHSIPDNVHALIGFPTFLSIFLWFKMALAQDMTFESKLVVDIDSTLPFTQVHFVP